MDENIRVTVFTSNGNVVAQFESGYKMKAFANYTHLNHP